MRKIISLCIYSAKVSKRKIAKNSAPIKKINRHEFED